MKKIIFTLLLSLCFISASAVQKDTIRILSIGNSFSEDAVEDHLYSVASEAGYVFIIGNMFIPGCSLVTHAANVRTDAPDYSYRKIDAQGVKTVTWGDPLSKAVKDEEWDIVTLQQASHFSGIRDTYIPYLQELHDHISKECPSAEIIFHMTWAYDANTIHHAFADYGKDQIRMYESILDAVGYAVEKVGIEKIIPSGTAVQNARTTVLGDKVNSDDGYHLSRPHGRYLAACVWFEFLTGRKVVGNPYCADGMSPQECRLAQKAAHAAVKRPMKITKIK